MNYTFDTNILLYIFRETSLKFKLVKALNLDNPDTNLFISIASVAEMRALALKNKWG
jgi:predicted nucleic acid-binding protein